MSNRQYVFGFEKLKKKREELNSDVSHQEKVDTLRCVDTFSCHVKIEEYFFRVFTSQWHNRKMFLLGTYSSIKKISLWY